jgi:hypothetical protein
MLNILLLCRLVAAAKQEQYDVFNAGEIHAIARPPINALFRYALTHGLAVSEIAKGHSVKPRTDSRPCLPVGKPFQPIGKRLSATSGLVYASLIQVKCNL